MSDSPVEFDCAEIEEPEEYDDPLSAESISQAVVYSTDWTTETLLSQLKRENISLEPKFQRRDAWSRSRKSRFIESLILGLPVPQIVLAEKKERKGQYIVLDGKQRLLTLLQFTGGGVGKNNNFALTGLEVRQDLNRKTFEELESSLLSNEDLDSLSNQPIRSVIIRNWPNSDFLHTVFVRLNMGSVALSPQELREALFPGPFVDYADERAGSSNAIHHLLKITEPDFRMRDVEILIRFLAFSFFLPVYAGNFKHFMDFTCNELNNIWHEEQKQIEDKVNSFELGVEAAIEIFGPDYIGRKWTKNGYESRLNRAVLDTMVFYFSDTSIREASLEHHTEVEAAFKILSEIEEFRVSVETTTKSIGAVTTRLGLWGEKLKSVLDMDFNIPVLIKNRIEFTDFWS